MRSPRPTPRSSPLRLLCRASSVLAAWLVSVSVVQSAEQAAPSPEWIWSDSSQSTSGTPGEVRWFRHGFRTPPYNWNARLTAVADGTAEVFLNGKRVAACDQPMQPVRVEVSMNLIQGENLLAVRVARRLPSPEARPVAGLLIHLNLGGTETRQVVSSAEWEIAEREVPGWTKPGSASTAWRRATSIGVHGDPRWGEVLSKASATPASALVVPPGFEVDLLRSAEADEGSWINLAFDPRGRLYVSPEGDSRPLLRIDLGADGMLTRVEAVPAPIRFAMGLLFAHGSLYANAKGPSGSGLYRLVDDNGNDRFDPHEVRFLKGFKGGGEHGYHALAAGPDGKIYVLNGNGTQPPVGLSADSPYRHYGEDVLSLNPEETSRASGALAPGCQILRTDPDGKNWELFCGGMRNAYGFDFGPDQELFAFDSDNEWDWGTPWYRPTRVFHCVSGAEMGWRDGTRAWPDSYPDQVPAVVDIGIGSPTGVRYGRRARFPGRYQRALFIQDWSYGRILAVHLEPHGATYRGMFEPFVKGQPLNLTSLDFGPDGALYFVTGGRGTQSGLYRVRYPGEILPEPPPAPSTAHARSAELRHTRRSLERLHGAPRSDAIERAWPHLADSDRAIRFAARIAVEAQPLPRWESRALAETNATTALEALLALARFGPPASQAPLLKALARFPLSGLDETQRLLKFRILELSFLRQGRPAPNLVQLAIDKLGPRFPALSWAENRELARLLLWLEAPGVVPRILDLVDQSPYQEHQIHYVSQLRNLRTGWTPADRRRYLGWWLQPRDHLQRPGSLLHWFHDVGRGYVDGASLDRHLEGFRREAIAAVPEPERPELSALAEQPMTGARLVPAEPRAFVRNWSMDEIVPLLDQVSRDRDFSKGRRAFIDTQCYACHRLGNTGGSTGPELGGVGSKYGRREILESLLEPSKVINDQFRNVRVLLDDGDDAVGRLIRDAADEVVLETDPISRTQHGFPRRRVVEIRPSDVSPMPEGLLQVLEKDEILDLLAFLESGGQPDAPRFRRNGPPVP